MADCSKTEVFLKEVDRLCDKRGDDFRDLYCELCPIKVICESREHDRKAILEEALDFVQKWSDEHPAPKQKTYADVFFEKFPNAPTMPDGLPKPYVCDVYTNHPECYGCTQEDSRKCWTLPYPERS